MKQISYWRSTKFSCLGYQEPRICVPMT